MQRPTPDLPSEAFRSADAAALGVTRRQLQSKRFVHLGKDVHVLSSVALDFFARCRAATLMLPSDAAFSHYTAARFYNAPVPDECLLHVNSRCTVEPRIRGIVTHRVQELGEVRLMNGVRVMTPARTFVDLASRLDLPGLVAAGDVLVGRCEGSFDELTQEIRRAGRRRGVRLAREAVLYLDPRSLSPMESRLRLLMMQAGFGRPESNWELYDEDGHLLAWVDLAYPRIKVGAEYEGSQHLLDRKQWNKDIHRYEMLANLGWIIVRVTAEDLYRRPEQVVARLREAIARAGKRG